MRRLIFTIFFWDLLLLVIVPTEAAWAQLSQDESPETAQYRTDSILVEGDVDEASHLKPTAFATILRPEKYHSRLLTVPELLSRQVGLFVKGFDGLGQLSTVSIRGSTAQQVSVYLDGIKINTAQGGAVDFSTIPMGGIERIEILRGGASSRFGSDAIGGVINIVTKKAQDKRSLQFKLSGGSFLTFETNEGFSQKLGKVGLTLNHSSFMSKGDFSFVSTGVDFAGGGSIGGGQTFTRIHNDFFDQGLLTGVNTEINEKMHLDFVNDFFFTSRDEPGPEVETTQLYPQNPLDAHRNLFRDSAGFQYHWDDVGVTNLRFSFLPNYDVEWNHFTDATPAMGGPIDVTFLNQSVGAKSQLLYECSTPHQDHVFTGFYEFRYNHFSDTSPLAEANLSGTHTRRTNAAFIQDEINLLGEKLLLNPSVRWQHADDFGNNVALHFGIQGKPASWVTLKGNVDNSFRYPTFDELFFPDEGFIRGNPNLQEESAFNFDMGTAFQVAWAGLELDYFHNAIDNSIIFVPITAFTVAPVNTGPVTAQGLEATVTLNPLEWLQVSGNYTFLHATFDGSGQQLPGRPKHLLNGQVQFTWKYFSLFSRVQFIDDLPIDFANTKFLQNRTLVDVGGTFKWRNRYFVTVEGKNVGNVQTLDAVGFPLPRASIYATFGYKS